MDKTVENEIDLGPQHRLQNNPYPKLLILGTFSKRTLNFRKPRHGDSCIVKLRRIWKLRIDEVNLQHNTFVK